MLLLEVKDIWHGFLAKQVLAGIDFKLDSGEIVGLVGPSGAGKSVFLKILGGVLQPDYGALSWASGKRGEVGFLFQEGALFDSLSVVENVMFALKAAEDTGSREPSSFDERADVSLEMLQAVGLKKAAMKLPGQLSGGMRRRVGIARALVTDPDLVLLDDPTGGLDPVAASVIMDLVSSLHEEHKPAIVIVSHDVRRLLPNVHRVVSLFDGRIVSDCTPHALIDEAPEQVVSFLRTRFDFNEFERERP